MRFLFVLLICSFINAEHYVLIGPPGSGKGTFSHKLVREQDYCQICPGDIVRTHIKNETELGKVIKPIVESGDYINDGIIYKIIEAQITECVKNKISFILDGFPRHENGYLFIKDLFKRLNIEAEITFVHFLVDDSTCIERISNRVVCFECYNVYNLKTKRPLIEMTCDECYKPLEIRLGDTIQNTKKRLLYFREIIEPIVELAQKDFKVLIIQS